MDVDPLSRTAASPRAASFYRGFFDAQQRLPTRQADPTLGQALGGALFAATPFAVAALFFARRRFSSRAAPAKSGGLFSGVLEQVRKQMDPMAARDFRVTVKDTRFSDVIGVPEAREEIQQYVRFLREPQRFARLGARLPRGCLLTGAPGTGKTLLARAVAGEADVPFFACSGADFIEVYAGSGPKRVRELFAAAREAAPAVVFVDEIDAIGSRGGGEAGEENRTVNQMLAELDGLRPSDGVVVLAATNFADSLDRALLRAGRFDRRVDIPLPDAPARAELFAHYFARVTLCAGTDAAAAARRLARLTPGAAPATISAIVNEAALACACAGADGISERALRDAVDDVLIGRRGGQRRRDATNRRGAALREGGRAVLAWFLPQQSDVVKVSIAPRGIVRSGYGATRQAGREAHDTPTALALFTDLCVLLAGRAVESVQLIDERTNAAGEDCERATRSAMQQFLAFGMAPERVGLLAFDPQRFNEGRMVQKHSEEMSRAAEVEASRLIEAAQRFTEEVIRARKADVLRVADALIEREELTYEEIEEILGKRSANQRLTEEAEQALHAFVQRAEGAKAM